LTDFQVAKCAYAVLVIGVFWVTEAMPLAVTSLLPVFLFPVLGVVPVQIICASYFKVGQLKKNFRCDYTNFTLVLDKDHLGYKGYLISCTSVHVCIDFIQKRRLSLKEY